jgi:hypothetical protein
MNISIKPDIVLIFYDMPILFIGIDQVGTKYLTLHIDSIDGKARYICRPVAPDTIIKLVKCVIDLRTAYLDNNIDCWYLLDTQDDTGFYPPQSIAFSDIPTNYLPNAGFFLDFDLEVDEKLVEDAYTKNKAVVCISFAEGVRQSINAFSLAEVVQHFQSVLKYAYKKAMTEVTRSVRDLIDTPNSYMLNAYASRAGSFKLYFESDSARDMFDGFDIRYALDRVELIVAEGDEEIIANLRRNSGHAISNYSKLLETVVKSGVSVTFDWIDPNGGKSVSKSIVPTYASHVLDIIKARTDLETVIVYLTGRLELEDTRTGSWRLVDLSGKTYNGTGDGDLLKGKTTNTVIYTLTCEEVIEEESVSGREKKKYVLKDIHNADPLLLSSSTGQ